MGGQNSTIDTLLNRDQVMSLLYWHGYLAKYTRSQGYNYVMGETNSCSVRLLPPLSYLCLTDWHLIQQGHGRDGVSNVFAAALWSIDYALYMATIDISRVFFHQGTTFAYSAWQPIDVNSTSLHHVMPLYYGNLFTATALAGGNKQVELLINETYFSAYGLYTQHLNGADLTQIIVVNTNAYDPSTGGGVRPYTSVQLPPEFEGARVKRLTAPSVYERTAITYAGQSVDNSGQIIGEEAIERVQAGQVSIGDSEALLITVSC